jgi:hypothetical protein
MNRDINSGKRSVCLTASVSCKSIDAYFSMDASILVFSDSLFIYDKFVTIKDLTSDTSSMKKQAQEPGDE